MALPEVFTDPIAYAALVVVITAVVVWQGTLGYRSARLVNRGKRLLFPLLERFRRPLVRYARRISPALGSVVSFGIPILIVDTERVGSDQYLVTWETDVAHAFETFVQAGYSYNAVSSLKRRPGSHGDDPPMQLSALSMVYYHDDGMQTEVYLFANPDDTLDVYAHYEASVTDPRDHLGDAVQAGDPRDLVPLSPTP